MNTRTSLTIIIAIALVVVLGYLLPWKELFPGVAGTHDTDVPYAGDIESFTACAQAGYPVMESYPRQCRTPDGQTFTEEVGNELEHRDMIRLAHPRPNGTVESPLTIRGEARGTWYFEASFPVVLTNWDGLIIAEGFAEAQDDWMTEDFVPFTAELTFKKPELYPERGTLILQKANPSGLPENDAALEIPISFE